MSLVESTATSQNYSHFLVKHLDNGVVHLQINRPKVCNSFAEETWIQYGEIIKSLNKQKDVKVIVLSGVGKHLSAGINLKTASKMIPDIINHNYPANQSPLKVIQTSIREGILSNIPIIGVVHGISYGLMVDLLTATSIRFSSQDARLSIKEIDIGIIPDVGVLPYITSNLSKLTQYSLTGEEFTGKDAKEIGFVSEVLPTKEDALQRAFKVANIIAKKYQPAVVGTKKNLELVSTNNEFVNRGLVKVEKDNVGMMRERAFKKFEAPEKPVKRAQAML